MNVMTKLKFIDLLAILLCITPFVAWFIVKDCLPERIPIHWNARGEVDGWTNSNQLLVHLLIMSAVGAISYLLLRFIKYIDPKRTAQMNETIALKLGLGIIAFMTGISLVVLLPKGESFNTSTAVFVMVSLLFTFLGNMMYNIKPNYFIGIRLPWTLEDENNWKHTHRLAGIVWFVGGIVSAVLVLALGPKTGFPFFIGITVLLVTIPGVYSFLLFRRTRRS
jgi:uncharacterized membrane protein